jgi:plastocyanin
MKPVARRARYWVAAAMLSLAACQGGGSDSAESESRSPAEIMAEGTEFQFTPNEWSVPAGADVMLTFTNDGTVDHSFAVVTGGDTVETAVDQEPIVQAEPGATEEGTFTAPADPGTYQVVCTIPGHLEAGMEATLNVTEP